MPFSQLNAAITFFEKVKKWRAKPEETVATRFVQLFEKHGVHRNQIPGFFGHDLTVAKVATDKELFPYLTEEVLSDAAELFAIRREWLDGVDKQIYPIHHFYKDPYGCMEFCKRLKAMGEGRISGSLFFCEGKKHLNDSAIILEEYIGQAGESDIYRYHILGEWVFSYWKCRVYMAACIAIASKQEIYIYGRELAYDQLKGYLGGYQFLGKHYDDLTNVSHLNHREDMTFSLEVLFIGLEKKLTYNDYEQAIYLWEELVDKGYMDDGITQSVLKDRTNNKFFKEKYLVATEEQDT